MIRKLYVRWLAKRADKLSRQRWAALDAGDFALASVLLEQVCDLRFRAGL